MKQESKNYWFKTLSAMTNGDVTQIEALQRTDVFDFFELLKVFEERQEELIRQHESRTSKLKRGRK